MQTAGCSVSSGSSNEGDLHLAAVRQRFRDRAFPCCRFRHANRDVFRWSDAVLSRRCSQLQRHVPEGCQERERLRQVYDHAPR